MTNTKSLLERVYDQYGAYSDEPLWVELCEILTGKRTTANVLPEYLARAAAEAKPPRTDIYPPNPEPGPFNRVAAEPRATRVELVCASMFWCSKHGPKKPPSGECPQCIAENRRTEP